MNLRTRIEQRNIRSARERVRHYLALNAGADGRTVALAGTLKDLAAELGLTHEALYRTLAALERSGAIKRGKGKIVLERGRAYDGMHRSLPEPRAVVRRGEIELRPDRHDAGRVHLALAAVIVPLDLLAGSRSRPRPAPDRDRAHNSTGSDIRRCAASCT